MENLRIITWKRRIEMSLYDYKRSQAIAMQDEPFYALIMAAMRQADTPNTEKLRHMWPEVYEELYYRYNAPGGMYPSEMAGAEDIARGSNEHKDVLENNGELDNE